MALRLIAGGIEGGVDLFQVFQQAASFFIVLPSSGVTVIRRVVRCRRETPRCASSCLMVLLSVALGISSESAARVKLPASTTRVKALRAENRSIIRSILVSGRPLSTEGKSVFQIRPFFRLFEAITVLSIPGGALSRAWPVYTLTKEMHHEQKTCG